jgi:hypothetical protein
VIGSRRREAAPIARVSLDGRPRHDHRQRNRRWVAVIAPTVFNRTVVADGDGFDSWYATVSQLPSDLAWQQAYELRFGTGPTAFADLYYDAASLLIRNLQNVSSIDSRLESRHQQGHSRPSPAQYDEIPGRHLHDHTRSSNRQPRQRSDGPLPLRWLSQGRPSPDLVSDW